MIAGSEIFLGEPLPDTDAQISNVERYRLAVEMAHSPQLRYQSAFLQAELLRHFRAGWQEFQADQTVVDFVPLLRHRFRKALKAPQRLKRLGLGNEHPLADHFEKQSFFLQFSQRLAHGNTADTVAADQIAFRRQPLMRLVDAGDDIGPQLIADARI